MLDDFLEDNIDSGTTFLAMAVCLRQVFPANRTNRYFGYGDGFHYPAIGGKGRALLFPFSLAPVQTKRRLIFICLRGRLAGVFGGLGGILFQEDRANEFKQGEHAPHEQPTFPGERVFL